MKSVKDVVDISTQEIGYLEKKSNKDLYDKTKNAGYGNFTKYAYEVDLKYPDWYNGKKNGFQWCTVFFDWTMIKAYGVEHARKMLYRPKKSLGASCVACVKYYKDNSAFFKTPKIGDQIFFKDSKGEACHTGRVIAITATKVYTIEGNTSPQSSKDLVVANGGGVYKKSYNLNYSRILGYGRPNFDLLNEPSERDEYASGSIPGKEKSKIQPITKYIQVIAKSGLNCRKEPSESAQKLGAFCFGQKLEMLSKVNSSWMHVKGVDSTRKSISGYVYSSYVKEV